MPRLAAVGCLLLGVAAGIDAQAKLSLEQVLDRFRTYLTNYFQTYSATVAIERYTQRAAARTLTLDSEFAMVRVPGRDTWVGFRDVLRSNGIEVASRSGRLAALFANPTAQSLDLASKIAQESARFNIGDVRRTVNNPAVVLEVLAPRHHERFRFSMSGEEVLGPVRSWVIDFVEHWRPTIIRSSLGDDEPIEGKLWIDPANGTLLRASIRILISKFPTESLHLDVAFREETKLQMWVPARMREAHELGIGSFRQTGDATYSDYRQFGVQTRIVH